MAAFFGQVGHECTGLTAMHENLNYKTEAALRSAYRAAQLGEGEVSRLLNDPEALANQAYANNGKNGPPESGDGWRFHGRGLMHLTLRENYQRFADHSGIDVVSDPDLIASPAYAVWSACWYWDWKRLNGLADLENVRGITHKINSAELGYQDRLDRTHRARDVLRRAVYQEPRSWLGN